MNIIKKYLTNGQYLTAEFEKTSIFLHHTAGLSAEGAWRWWNQTPERVGTPYIIDRNGTIVECFDPKIWAFHLGINGDDNYHEMHSVNIELVSGGRLYRGDDSNFYFYPLYPNKVSGKIIPKDEVMVLTNPWRGYSFYHKYTEAQMIALGELLNKILTDFPTIVPQTDFDGFYDFNPDVLLRHIGGIWSHSTVRIDKDDIFPYKPLVDVLESLRVEKPIKTNTEPVIPNISPILGEEKSIKPNISPKKSTKKKA